MEQATLLDHGHVCLLDRMGGDLTVVRNARQSYDAVWRAGKDEGSDKRLIMYLMKNRHTSPFEHVMFTFGIKCPIFVARQIRVYAEKMLEFIRPYVPASVEAFEMFMMPIRRGA